MLGDQIVPIVPQLDAAAKLLFIIGGLIVLFFGWFGLLVRRDEDLRRRTAADEPMDRYPGRLARIGTGVFVCLVGIVGILMGTGVLH